MLKKIGIGILIVIGLVVIISFFLPKNVTVERSIVINGPVESIYDQVNDLRNWAEWSPWAAMDPDMKVEYSGSEKGKDAKYCWDGDPNTVGKGCLTIVDNEDNASIATLLEFEGMAPGQGSWKFEEVEEGIKVSWAMNSDLSKPAIIGKYFGFSLDGMLGPSFESGLNKMKEIVESMPQNTYSIDISESEVPGMQYVYVRRSANAAEIGNTMNEMAGQMMAFIEKNGLENGKNVFAIWHVNDMVNDNYDFSFAFEVLNAEEIENDNVKFGKRKAFECARGVHLGAYDKMEGSYGEMMKYVKDNGYTEDKEYMEFYITDPMEQPDTAKWETHIVYPIS